MKISFKTDAGGFHYLPDAVGDRAFSILEETDGDIYFVIQSEGKFILSQVEGGIVSFRPCFCDPNGQYQKSRRFRRLDSTLTFTEEGV
jgi:hypothetical protein